MPRAGCRMTTLAVWLHRLPLARPAQGVECVHVHAPCEMCGYAVRAGRCLKLASFRFNKLKRTAGYAVKPYGNPVR